MTEKTIIRQFLPVGQGAFYTERCGSVNVVYDCGNEGASRRGKAVVRQRFTDRDEVECLFLSHFDYDHVSLVPTLLSYGISVKYVILPLLHDQERILLSTFHKVLGNDDIAHMIEEPNDYYGPETHVIYVKPRESEMDAEVQEEGTPLDSLDQEISSGTRITLHGNANWIYAPFNIDHHNRQLRLLEELEAQGIDPTRFRDELEYSLKHRAEAREAYNSVGGDINQNSLVVYSGPPAGSKASWFRESICRCGHYHHCILEYNTKVACVYTGDSDFKQVKIRGLYPDLIDRIGTVQTPHHGSEMSFDIGALDGCVPIVCPISFGRKNRYGHPSGRVIGLLNECGCMVPYVTESADSVFTELLRVF